MSVCLPDYRIASGHDVALASLQQIVTFVQSTSGRRPIVAPNSQPVNRWPVETVVGDGQVRGDGRPGHEWNIGAMRIAAFTAFLQAYLYTTGSPVKSKAVTIYTPTFDLGDGMYTRYNAYLIWPVPGEDYRYFRKAVVDLRLRFSRLVAL